MSDISDQRKYIERMIGEIVNMYREQFDQLNAENAKLREEVEQWHRLTAGIELPEYPITQFQPKDLERENTKLREQIERLQPKDCEGNALDIADTVSMLRSEYDGDHEWDDVVVELVLTKWGGDRWIVRGSKGEAWACDCTKTGYDEDAFEESDDVEPFDDATLAEVDNAKLRELAKSIYINYAADGVAPLGMIWEYASRLRELGVEL